MNIILHPFFSFLSRNRLITYFAKRFGMKAGARRVVAGTNLTEALEVADQLNKDGMSFTMDHLGEYVDQDRKADEMMKTCIQTLYAINKNHLYGNLSLKATSLGLDISKTGCFHRIEEIVSCAHSLGLFVRIDMEDSQRNEDILDIYSTLARRFPESVGVVLQASLYKSSDDLKRLQRPQSNFRLCKGAYLEKEDIAFQQKVDVNKHFRQLIRTQLLSEGFTAIATHDKRTIDWVLDFAEKNHVSRGTFEFQMLYGIRPELQRELAAKGLNVRIYLPFGRDWWGYFTRRLAERPANVWFVLTSLNPLRSKK